MRTLMIFVFCLVAGTAQAETWTLNADLSALSFGSIKKGNIGETHHFTELSGTVTDKGEATVIIPLASVETWIDVRNERMRDFLFETKLYPEARISAAIPATAVHDAAPGAVTTVNAPVTLSLHGSTATFQTDMVVARLSPTRVVVVPAELLMIDADKFGMTPGLQKLMELATLPAISSAVPVTFHFVFDKNP